MIFPCGHDSKGDLVGHSAPNQGEQIQEGLKATGRASSADVRCDSCGCPSQLPRGDVWIRSKGISMDHKSAEKAGLLGLAALPLFMEPWVVLLLMVAVLAVGRVWRTRVGALSSGTTAGTFGATVSVNVPTDASTLVGLETTGSDPTYTTAEGAGSVVRLRSDSFAHDIELLTGPFTTSGPATNGSGQAMVQDHVALLSPISGGGQVNVEITTTTTITTARLHEVVLLTADKEPPDEWFAGSNDGAGAFSWAKTEYATQLTTARTGLTAIQVPGDVGAIRGIRAAALKTGAITAAEEVMGFFDLSTTTLQAIGDQIFPTNALGATVGTPVGTGLYHDRIPWQKCAIPIGGKQQTVTPSINLRTAVTTANRVAICVAGA